MPDLQAWLSQFYRAQSELTALIGQRCYTEIPGRAEYPLLRLTDIGGSNRTGPALWQQQGLVQHDCWGGPTSTAALVAETCRALLMERAAGEHHLADGARIVITSVVPGRARRGADTTWPGAPADNSSAKPKASFDAVINFHP